MGRLQRTLCLGLTIAFPGRAQEPEDEGTFTYDTVLVAPVQPLSPATAAPAAALTAQLQERLSASVLTVDISEVPPFVTQGYDARVYVESCPPGEYTGCALVVGQRVEADWVVGGTLASVDDALGDGQVLFQVHFVDIRASREVLTFGLVLPTTGADRILDQLAQTFDRIIDGAFEEVDLRGNLEDPEIRKQLERAREQLIASSLDELEQSIGGLERGDPITAVEAPKLTREDLAQYAGRDDSAPWERVGMTEGQFLRYRNAGVPLDTWRARLRGRFGQVLLRGGLAVGPGPWGVRHEGQYLQDFDAASSTFRTVEIVQFQESSRAASTGLDTELALGVAPFLEVGFALTIRSSQIRFLFDQETVGEPSFVEGPSGTTASTLAMGPRLNLVPLPSFPVRPTLGLGLAWWRARGVPPPIEPFVRLDAPKLTLLQVFPGVEASAGRFVNLWLRMAVEQPMGGSTFAERNVGGGLLPEPPVPSRDERMALGVHAGLQFRLTLLAAPSSSTGAARFEDDEP